MFKNGIGNSNGSGIGNCKYNDDEGCKYESLGVDVHKAGIHSFKRIIDELFPGSFCPILKHPLDPSKGIILHEDGAGTKPIVSYLFYKETGDPKYFSGLAKDVIAMNVDDVICVGATPLAMSDYIALNPFVLEKGELLGALADGFSTVLNELRCIGSDLCFCGGETAELPDIIRTFDISCTVYAEVPIKYAITGSQICPGDIIVGLRSGGRSSLEDRENSGLMCNGITLARHVLLSSEYPEKYPEIICPEVEGYRGRYKLDSYVDELGMTVGEALISPTRIYLPLVQEVLRKVEVKALVHNTGGGLTKCLRVGRSVSYIKDTLPEPDPIFQLIQKEGKVEWREMYQVFNMGVGMELVVGRESLDQVIDVCDKFRVGAQKIGRCERSSGGNSLLIKSRMGTFNYVC
ncbi:MAG: phosphoribosylformylglycinamidine cyclo-ligase [Candidatus Verstraetearchaeota archaeon]|jgi:phosphoribosylformylglycinamidine cyclo-ligase|nr:phosphoribosylformylglycinamidine cyclo-ligase [Candidatus Verstraetearchaeota archaeon]